MPKILNATAKPDGGITLNRDSANFTINFTECRFLLKFLADTQNTRMALKVNAEATEEKMTEITTRGHEVGKL